MVGRRRSMLRSSAATALAALALAASTAACDGAARAAPPPEAPVTAPAPPAFQLDDPDRSAKVGELAQALRAQIAREFEAGTTPSLVFALVVDDDVPVAEAHGLADVEAQRAATTDTAYRIASVTKTFTAAAIVKLRDAGALRLEDPASRYVTELAEGGSDGRAAGITIEQLLTHTSGLPRSGPWATREPDYRSSEDDIVGSVRSLAGEPGAGFSYSNLGFALLGLVVSRASHEAYRDYVKTTILDPLGMSRTAFEPDAYDDGRVAAGYYGGGPKPGRAPAIANGAAEGAGGLWSTADDLTRWIRFHLAAWPATADQGAGPLSRASLREMHSAHVVHEVQTRAADGGGRDVVRARAIGLAWKVERSCEFAHLVEHGGDLGGYRTRIWMAPERGFGFVLLANAANAPVDAMSERVLATIAASGALPRRGRDGEPTPGEGGLRCAP